MALNVTSSYAGHELIPLLTPMFDSMREIQDGDITLHNDVNFKKALRKMTTSGILQSDSAGFTPSGDVTISEKVLFPTIQKVNLQIDKNDLRDEWSSARMGKGQMNKKIAADINEGVIKNILGTVGEGLRTQMWNDNGTVLPQGGFRKQLVDSTDATKVTDSGATTAGNVLDRLSNTIKAMNPKYLSFDKTRVFVAADVWGAYSTALSAESNMLNSTQATSYQYAGYKMVMVPELEAGDIIIGNKGNFHYGTDIFSDLASVNVLDQEYVTGAAQVHFIQRVAIDVKIGFTSEVGFFEVV